MVSLMGQKFLKSHHHSVVCKVNEQMGTKRGYTWIQAYRAWLPKFLALGVMVMAFGSLWIYRYMDADVKVRRRDVLGSMCDQRARMLQDQFSVTVNHVHALAILVSTFHFYKNPSAIDQVHDSAISKLTYMFSFLVAYEVRKGKEMISQISNAMFKIYAF